MKASGWKFGSEKDLRTHIRTIDDRKNPELVKRFAIKSFPTFLIVDRGEVIERLVGYRTAEALNASYNRKRDDERKPE